MGLPVWRLPWLSRLRRLSRVQLRWLRRLRRMLRIDRLLPPLLSGLPIARYKRTLRLAGLSSTRPILVPARQARQSISGKVKNANALTGFERGMIMRA
jgi:hypothetical protein